MKVVGRMVVFEVVVVGRMVALIVVDLEVLQPMV